MADREVLRHLDGAPPEQLLLSRHQHYGAELSCRGPLGRPQQQHEPRCRTASRLVLNRGAHGQIPRNASYDWAGDFPESPDLRSGTPSPPADAVRCANFFRAAVMCSARISNDPPAVPSSMAARKWARALSRAGFAPSEADAWLFAVVWMTSDAHLGSLIPRPPLVGLHRSTVAAQCLREVLLMLISPPAFGCCWIYGRHPLALRRVGLYIPHRQLVVSFAPAKRSGRWSTWPPIAIASRGLVWPRIISSILFGSMFGPAYIGLAAK